MLKNLSVITSGSSSLDVKLRQGCDKYFTFLNLLDLDHRASLSYFASYRHMFTNERDLQLQIFLAFEKT